MQGLDLKLRRTAARVKGTELARAMGVSSSRVCVLESQDLVSEKATRRYLAALSHVIAARQDPTPGELMELYGR